MIHVANVTITKGSDVDVFDGAEQLFFERCRDIFELAPLSSVFCVTSVDGACVGGTGAGRDGWVLPRIGGFDESSWVDGGVGCRRKNQTEVAIVSTAQCCRKGSGVCFELVFESVECCLGRFANEGGDLGGKSVCEVLNAWDGGSHWWGVWEIEVVCCWEGWVCVGRDIVAWSDCSVVGLWGG